MWKALQLAAWLHGAHLGEVRHFRPDLVVSAYSLTGQNPWTEMSPLSPPLSGIAEDGGHTNPRSASTVRSA